MRIYNRKNFLKLPDGTIFCKGARWCFDNLSIKGQSGDNDFFYVDLCNINADETGQLVDRLEDSLENGNSYTINNQTMRDGTFDEESIFLVYEKKDLELLIDIMKISLNEEKLSKEKKSLKGLLKALVELTQNNIEFIEEKSTYYPINQPKLWHNYREEIEKIQDLINSFDLVEGKHE